MSKLIDQMHVALQARHYSTRTEKAYCLWAKRFIRYHGLRHPADMGEGEINAFLTHLAVDEKVIASTQTQALSAILFLYRSVLAREVGELTDLVRARKSRRLPVVLARDEVTAIIDQLDGDRRLAASLMYGSGFRLMECLRLRVLDLELARSEILVRDGKGGKDRVTMLPQSLRPAVERQLDAARALHRRDLAEGWGRVQLPDALERKYPNAPTDWSWQWVFPQQRRWRDSQTGQQGRHHLHETIVQRAMKTAVGSAGITKHASCHTAATHCATRSQRICSSRATTSAPSRSCSATRR